MIPGRAYGAALLGAVALGGFAVALARAHQEPSAEERLARAEQRFVEQDYAGATRELERIATRAESTGDDRIQVEHHRLATLVAAATGRVADAERHLDAGLVSARSSGAREAEARLLLAGAAGAWQRADYTLAGERLEGARAIAAALSDDALSGTAGELEGRLELKRGNYARSAAALESAGSACAAAADLRCAAQIEETSAALALDQLDLARARAGYERARARWLEAGDATAANVAAARVAVAHLFQGADETGYRLVRAAAVEAQASGLPAALAHALQVQGRAATALGLLDEADQVLATAARLRARLGDPRQRAWVEAARAKALAARGDPAAAHRELDKAIGSWRAIEDRRALAWHLLERARLEVALGLSEAGASFVEAIELAEAIDLPYLPLFLSEQARWLATTRGDLPAATAAAERAVAAAGDGRDVMLWPALAARGAVARAAGRDDAALADLLAAVESAERLRRSALAGDESEVGSAERTRELYAELVTLLVAAGRAEEALAVRERGRGFEPAVSVGIRSPADSVAANGREALAALRRAARERPTTLVSYLVTEDRLLAWVIRPDGTVRLATAPISRARLETLIETAQVSPGVASADRDRARAELAAAVLTPIEPWLAADDSALLTLAPDGPLHRLGFAALPLGDGRPLVEKARLHFVPTLAAAAPQFRPSTSDARSALLFADPAAGRLPGENLPLPRLPGARREVERVSALLDIRTTIVFVGDDATEERFRELAPRAATLHFAGHALPRDDHPRASFLALAPTRAPGLRGNRPASDRDGRLSVGEIRELDLVAELVVLSGCGSARGRATAAGTLSLSSAFLRSGSRRVLATLWPVTDDLAAELVARFYAERRENAREEHGDDAGALRAAQIGFRNALRNGELKRPSGAPYPEDASLWSGFVLIGDPG